MLFLYIYSYTQVCACTGMSTPMQGFPNNVSPSNVSSPQCWDLGGEAVPFCRVWQRMAKQLRMVPIVPLSTHSQPTLTFKNAQCLPLKVAAAHAGKPGRPISALVQSAVTSD